MLDGSKQGGRDEGAPETHLRVILKPKHKDQNLSRLPRTISGYKNGTCKEL